MITSKTYTHIYKQTHTHIYMTYILWIFKCFFYGNAGEFSGCALRWRHNEWDGVSNHQPHDCLLSRLFGRRSTKTSKLRVTGLCAGNSPRTGEFPAQMASYAENVSIWWRHHDWTLHHRVRILAESCWLHLTTNALLLPCDEPSLATSWCKVFDIFDFW